MVLWTRDRLGRTAVTSISVTHTAGYPESHYDTSGKIHDQMDGEGTIERIPPRTIVLLEEEAGCMKDFFTHKVATETAAEGKTVVYITSHFADEVMEDMRYYGSGVPENLHIVEGCRTGESLMERCSGDLCIIDPFSTLFLDHDQVSLMHLLSGIKEQARKGASFLLVSDMGVLPEGHEQLVRAMADGVIRFVTIIEGDKIKRYMRVLKMRGALPVDRMIPFTITDEGLQIDTRERLG